MPHIHIILGHYLICRTNYAVAEAKDPEENFRIVLELSDNMPEKADLLEKCGVAFARSFFGNANKKEDIDNCVLAYEAAVHLTPQGNSNMSGRLKKLGLLLYHRFGLAGDLTDISKAILYQEKLLHLTPEGHADMPTWLNNLGDLFQSRFEQTGDLADISNAILYTQKVLQLTSEGHANMSSQLNNLGILF